MNDNINLINIDTTNEDIDTTNKDIYTTNEDIDTLDKEVDEEKDEEQEEEEKGEDEGEGEEEQGEEEQGEDEGEGEDEGNKNYGYPKVDDPDIQYKLYNKREFYYYKLPQRPDLSNYKELDEYRKKICNPAGSLLEHQSLLSNFINPDTPYKGLLVFHGTGSGKCKRGCEYDFINGQLIKAEDVWNKYADITTLIPEDEGSWCYPKEPLIVNSFKTDMNKNETIILQQVKRLYREKINSIIREIIFDDETSIGITFVHKLFKKDCYDWSNELYEGDEIAVPVNVHRPHNHQYNLKINNPELLGLLYNATINSEKIVLNVNDVTNDDINNIKNIIEKSTKYDIIYNISLSMTQSSTTTAQVIVYCNKLATYIQESRNQNILDTLINNCNDDTIAKFIKGFDASKSRGLTNEDRIKINMLRMIGTLEASGVISYKKIVKINVVEYNDYVYDLEIDTYHNYVCNGILCHNTCAALAIAEKFKPMVQRYGTPIYILVPGPIIKQNWKESLLICTGDTYLKQNENLVYINDEEREKQKNLSIQNALLNYKIMSYRSFYRKVLGEKIVDKKVIEDNKIKVSYRKTEEGDFERNISTDRLYNLNNSLIIIDEAHNLTDNTYGEALLKIIKNSINLKVVLLTATPMKNLADDIIELLNFIRPPDSPIQRDLVFTSQKNYLMEFKKGGLEYLKKMASGYISHLRGNDPVTFATKIEMGDKPKGLIFTNITRCFMDEFQQKTYDNAVIIEDDSLDRKSEAVSNFVFPGLSDDKKSLVGLYGRDGLNTLRNQLKTYYDKINGLIAKDLFGLKKNDIEFINYNETTKNITGAILKKEYLKKFSTKFYQSLVDLEENIFSNSKNKYESRTGFVYSNLVKVGIELYQEILIQNGWNEYNENSSNYIINDNTICYHCGLTHKEHKEQKEHTFKPATYLVVTGGSSDEVIDISQDNKQKIISSVFNNNDNIDGKNIKLIIGSKVINEGISLKNVSSVYILDVYFNFGRVDQVVARAIRWCSHINLMNEKNQFPKVKLYKYAIGLKDGKLSSEEDLYYKAELKYLLIKKVERALKEVAIDCALLKEGNMFKEEITKYNKCIKPTPDLADKLIKNDDKDKGNICPSQCDYEECEYICDNKLLNKKYYDPNRKLYKNLKSYNLDYSTFTFNLSKNEVNFAKTKIKELYMTNYVYNLQTIIDYVKESYPVQKKDLFDNFFVQKALDELIPVTENDFNNFKDVIYDKLYRAGYLIYLDTYYIFQPFDENENVPMYYRTHRRFAVQSKLSLYNYIHNEKKNMISIIKKDMDGEDITNDNGNYYNFDDVMDYYDNRDEHEVIGIIDKELNRGKSKHADEINDVFKIREKREKILDKKRGTGIPSLKGSVCATSKQKEYLEKLAKDLGIKFDSNIKRDDICIKIKDKLIELEKYSKGKKKITYIMIPKNHPEYKFPLNLEDRTEYLKDNINKLLSKNIKFNVKEGKDIILLSFTLGTQEISANDIKKIKSYGWESKDNSKWTIEIS